MVINMCAVAAVVVIPAFAGVTVGNAYASAINSWMNCGRAKLPTCMSGL